MEPSCLLGTTRCIPLEKLPRKPYNKSFMDQVCSVKMAGYWCHSFFASSFTLTLSQSINTEKKNLANIQPSSPHTWSITHTSGLAEILTFHNDVGNTCFLSRFMCPRNGASQSLTVRLMSSGEPLVNWYLME